jgi:2-haloacid dehalogenase
MVIDEQSRFPTKGDTMAEREALAFDMYGTLVDPIGISKQLEVYLPEEAPNVAEVWRQKQLEYTFRLTAMELYEDFEQVTRKALDYALAAAGQDLGPHQKDALMERYNHLERFADVEPGLERLKEAGHAMVVFSNGAPRMLEALIDAADLRPYFQGFVSVDEVRVYKPSPKTYRHVARRLERPIGEVRLVSSNPFDDIGAEAAGMQAAWVDRSGGPFDTLGSPPEIVVGSLTELADALE